MGKTVYVLGAGFSKPAGFPLQGAILTRLIDTILNPDFLSGESIPLDASEPVEKFLRRAGYLRQSELWPGLTLEDLFTLLDQTISDKSNYAGFTWHRLIEVREGLVRCILGLLHSCGAQHLDSDKLEFKAFAAKAMETRLSDHAADKFSIVSLNWDGLVEESLYWVLHKTAGIQGGRALADVDYCVYTRPLPTATHMPSTKQKAFGIYNIKVLKMHGSATWLRCPCSNHLYTGLGSPSSAYEIYVKPTASPFILDYLDEREQDSPSMLEPYIITPTFAKVFDLPHIQTTWHNAFVELREATEVVFIGYSLPDADYHFRTLLRRAIRSSTRVRVVLHESDNPQFKVETVQPGPKAVYPADRYQQVFGKEQITFDYSGVEGFAEHFAPISELQDTLDKLRVHFARISQSNAARDGNLDTAAALPPTDAK